MTTERNPHQEDKLLAMQLVSASYVADGDGVAAVRLHQAIEDAPHLRAILGLISVVRFALDELGRQQGMDPELLAYAWRNALDND